MCFMQPYLELLDSQLIVIIINRRDMSVDGERSRSNQILAKYNESNKLRRAQSTAMNC